MGIIRFLLAASVICAHFGGIYGNNLIGGALAVQSFFLLSGFYIVLILEENFSVKSFQEYKSFLSSRLFRLYPAYWLSLAIKFIWGVGFSSTFYSLNLFSKLYIVLSNLFLFNLDLLCFQVVNSDGSLSFAKFPATTGAWAHELLTLNIPAWTLGTELWFYLLIPIFYPGKLRNLIIICLAIFLFHSWMLHFGLTTRPWNYRFFGFEIRWFMLVRNFMNWRFLKFLAFFAPFIFYVTKSSKIDRFIGNLSYPIYIFHFSVSGGMGMTKALGGNSALNVLIASTIFATGFNLLIQNPIDRWRHKKFEGINQA